MGQDAPSGLARRIGQIEDKLAVGELFSKYCIAIDQRDFDLWASLWTEDALWSTGYHEYRGRSEIRRGLAEDILSKLHDTHHYTMNPLTTLLGDTATALSDLFYVGTDKAGTALTCAASYRDRLVRDGGVWRFEERVIDIHFWVPWREGWGIDIASRRAVGILDSQ